MFQINFKAFTPSDATNKTIVWSIKDAGTTGASILDNTLNTTAEGTVEITATIANGLAIGTDYTQDFNILINSVGVNELEFTNYELRVYPNPTMGKLTIENGELIITSVELFDVYGRKQISNLKSQISNLIDISHLSAGVYFVKISTDKGEMMKKVLKE